MKTVNKMKIQATRTTRTWVDLLLVLMFASVSAAITADAQTATSDVKISLVAAKVSAASNGKEKLVEATRAVPGDVVQYDAQYFNPGKSGVSNLSPTLPIPAGMTYLSGTAQPAAQEASLDGKTFSAIPLKRKITHANGSLVEEEIPASEYRALRWQIGNLAAGSKTNVTARVSVSKK